MNAQRWLEAHFGCRLQKDASLRQALSHRSVGSENNERLEFLGDAVLDYVISEALYERFPEADEGQLSRLRVSLVKGSALAKLAAEIELADHLLVGAGQNHSGVRQRSSVLADTLEALLGAIVLDQGVEACRQAIFRIFGERLDSLSLDQVRKDPKTRLQEYLQGRHRPLPHYRLVDAWGEDHNRSFRVACELEDGTERAEAEGRSRRAAEQAAAGLVLQSLGQG